MRLSEGTSSTFGDTITTSSGASSQEPFWSPLGFLQAALPHICTETLNRALGHHGDHVDDIDMEAVVEGLLTDEYLRELEERGLEQDEYLEQRQNYEQSWQTSDDKGKSNRPGVKTGKPKHKKALMMALGDIRQTQRVSSPSTRDGRIRPIRDAVTDPWTRLSSLSTYIASLVPPHPPSLFQSFFHSPKYRTPYDALRAALITLCAGQFDSDQQMRLLLDVLLPSYDNITSEQRSRLISDTHLALNVTQGRGEDALDLIKFLRDLDSDSAPGCLDMGIYHSRQEVPRSPVVKKTPSPIPSPPSPTFLKQSPTTTKPKPDPFQWQTVPLRKTPNSDTNPLAAFIPAYNEVTGDWNRGKSELSLSQAQKCRRRMEERLMRRNELLRQASQAWQRGNSRTRGGEVALYFAQRVRLLLIYFCDVVSNLTSAATTLGEGTS
jgi:hypothetical protein